MLVAVGASVAVACACVASGLSVAYSTFGEAHGLRNQLAMPPISSRTMPIIKPNPAINSLSLFIFIFSSFLFLFSSLPHGFIQSFLGLEQMENVHLFLFSLSFPQF